MLSADQKIVIVTRRTRLQQMVERFNTRSQAKFFVSRAHALRAQKTAGKTSRTPGTSAAAFDGEFSDYELEDQTYRAAIDRLLRELDFGLKVQVVEREFLPNFVFGSHDIVVPVGQDGLVANVAKYALQQPIVAVNPDPARFDGILLPFNVTQARSAVRATLDGNAPFRQVTLAEAQLSDGQRLLAFNDLFIGHHSHVSARYRIQLDDHSEPQSSSGVLISTGAGSTGWLSSVFNMASGLARLTQHAAAAPPMRLRWDDPRLVFVVREPFVSKYSRADLVAGVLQPDQKLELESLMPTDGIIFSDGVEADFLQFNSGCIASIHAAAHRVKLVVAEATAPSPAHPTSLPCRTPPTPPRQTSPLRKTRSR